MNEWILECEPVFDDDGNSIRMPVDGRYSDGQTTTLHCPAVHVERLIDGILVDLETMILGVTKCEIH